MIDYIKRLIVMVSVLTLGIAGNVFSVPSISSISGTLTNGQQAVISGSGFGTKSTQNGIPPVAFGDMENNSTSARIGTWASTGNRAGVSGFMQVSNQHQRHSHSQYNGMCNFDTWATCGFEGGSDAPQWYAQYWFYLDSDFSWGTMDGTGANNKIFRMWHNGDNQNNMRIGAPFNLVDICVENTDSGHGGYGTGWSPVVPGGTCANAVFGHSCAAGDWWAGNISWRNFVSDMTPETWHHFQFEWQDGDIGVANGILRWWVDGKLVFNHSDITTRNSSNTGYMHPFIVGLFASHTTGDASGHYYIDDAYIDNTWQRVEIGNNATYNNCTLKEIQSPTAWNDTGITFTVNQGSFDDGSTGYVFITDTAGTRNTGYSITFGSTGLLVNGSCGTASGASYYSLSSSSPNLCASGTVASFTGSGPWTWGCDGSGGGTSTASNACTASLTTYGTSSQSAVVLGTGFITGVVK